ncbi:MAG: high frequency lysogenization protein HflD [Gammaproteobacteria bacterium]|nr:high frequency lysogenization protein HflD [Gammaproteobacteria bacterium]MDD9895965.1 high frequency lysogenization protein HflD [Gammaproteobacteria bacterium]MDD9958620.1 high frequency lysogenization protein HflD [Gammaproteobacteria bacterium]
MNSTVDKFSRWEYQNVALAAVAQCAALVNTLAVDGKAPQTELVASINPLLVVNSSSVAEIYPKVADFELGLRTIQEIFSNERSRENTEIVRYTLGMLLLRNKLASSKRLQNELRQRLQLINPIESIESPNGEINAAQLTEQDRIFEQLAQLYQDTISTLSYRIQVQGKIENLKNENVANRIRALLLGGIRSAVLWYQLGGRRWRLVFYRKRVQETAGNIRRKLLTLI